MPLKAKQVHEMASVLVDIFTILGTSSVLESDSGRESPQTELLMSSVYCGQTVRLPLGCLTLAKAKARWQAS